MRTFHTGSSAAPPRPAGPRDGAPRSGRFAPCAHPTAPRTGQAKVAHQPKLVDATSRRCPYQSLIRDSMTAVATESPRLRDIPILALLLVPTGLILTLVDWLFHFLPEPLDVLVSVLSVAGCLYWAWWFQRRDKQPGAGGRHRTPSSRED